MAVRLIRRSRDRGKGEVHWEVVRSNRSMAPSGGEYPGNDP
jgi:hypothetical protein